MPGGGEGRGGQARAGALAFSSIWLMRPGAARDGLLPHPPACLPACMLLLLLCAGDAVLGATPLLWSTFRLFMVS